SCGTTAVFDDLAQAARRISAGVRRFSRLRKPERTTTLYVPQYAHLRAPYTHVIRHVDGAVFACFSVEGAPFEDLSEAGAAGMHEQLCSLFRSLSMRSQLTLTTYLVRREAGEADIPRLLGGDRLARSIDAGYRRRLIGE